MHLKPSSPISPSVLAIHLKFFLDTTRQPLRPLHIHFQPLVATPFGVVGPSFPPPTQFSHFGRSSGAFSCLFRNQRLFGAHLPYLEGALIRALLPAFFGQRPSLEGCSHASAFWPTSSKGFVAPLAALLTLCHRLSRIYRETLSKH